MKQNVVHAIYLVKTIPCLNILYFQRTSVLVNAEMK